MAAREKEEEKKRIQMEKLAKAAEAAALNAYVVVRLFSRCVMIACGAQYIHLHCYSCPSPSIKLLIGRQERSPGEMVGVSRQGKQSGATILLQYRLGARVMSY